MIIYLRGAEKAGEMIVSELKNHIYVDWVMKIFFSVKIGDGNKILQQ